MKTFGIVREIDHMGRVVLPRELCNTMMIDKGESIEIFRDKKKIILKKVDINCLFCGKNEGLKKVNGKNVCLNCLQEIKELDI